MSVFGGKADIEKCGGRTSRYWHDCALKKNLWEDAPLILRLEFSHWAMMLMGQVYYLIRGTTSKTKQNKSQRRATGSIADRNIRL
jgi:hypothetical protein